ncbi:MAG: hypothetical protein K9G64_03160 [Bacteroidia bacterium]|nr:hypothetical protein [Bacteroidia bacterium]
MKALLIIILVFILPTYKVTDKRSFKEICLPPLKKEMVNKLAINSILIFNSQKPIKIDSDFEINHSFSKIQLLIINVTTIIIIMLVFYLKIKFID